MIDKEYFIMLEEWNECFKEYYNWLDTYEIICDQQQSLWTTNDLNLDEFKVDFKYEFYKPKPDYLAITKDICNA